MRSCASGSVGDLAASGLLGRLRAPAHYEPYRTPLLSHTSARHTLRRQVERDEHQIDQLDADERQDDAADAIEQQVAPQQRRRAQSARYLTPRSASGISATMMSALKITAESTALCGVASRMTLSACSCG